jgi:hypothetical protein
MMMVKHYQSEKVVPLHIGTKSCIHGKCFIMPKFQQNNLQWCLYIDFEGYVFHFVFFL